MKVSMVINSLRRRLSCRHGSMPGDHSLQKFGFTPCTRDNAGPKRPAVSFGILKRHGTDGVPAAAAMLGILPSMGPMMMSRL